MSLVIFIGYVGNVDKKIAKICESRFATCGADPILSEETYEDDDIQNKIFDQLGKSNQFVAIHSARSLQSAWLHQELGYFLGYRHGNKAGIHILARSPDDASDSRKIAMCCSKNYLAITRSNRDADYSEHQSWTKKNQDTLQSALDMLVYKMISDKILVTKRVTSLQLGPHKMIELHEDLLCCGPSKGFVPYRVYNHGWVIKLLGGFTCPRCNAQYGIDPLTWEAVSRSPEPESNRFLELERKLYERSVTLADLRNRTSHQRSYYSGQRLREIKKGGI